VEPHTTTHYWIAVLDLEDFSSRPDPIQVSLHEAMFRLVRTAVGDANLDWDTIGIKDEGDGLILFFPADVSPVRVAGDVVDRLGAVLAEAAAMYSEEHRMRFRLALHHGLATPEGTGWPGDATNVACRLVDVDLLRTVLSASPRAHLAVIASDDFYRSVIRPGHRSIDPATYAPVVVDLKKAPCTKAWVRVPGYPTPNGLPPHSASPRDDGPTPVPSGSWPPAATVTQKFKGDYVAGPKFEENNYYGGRP
jgi:hypothetical protein